MKPSEVKKEYQLQQWAGTVKEQKESGLTVRQWCLEQGSKRSTTGTSQLGR